MKALTVRQPWCWLILHGPKRYENRRWRTAHRGPLLIHAAKTPARIDVRQLQTWRRQGIAVPPGDRLPMGAVVGICELTACLTVDGLDDPWATGPWCWRLDRVQAWDRPVLYSGDRGLFELPDDLIADQAADWLSPA
ncbi:MAG: ASCH domain-containing protein [bacterium]|nr:ASCH domain-containing protein [bacterium]